MEPLADLLAAIDRGESITAEQAKRLERVARLDEREACARIADEYVRNDPNDEGEAVAKRIAGDIRSRPANPA